MSLKWRLRPTPPRHVSLRIGERFWRRLYRDISRLRNWVLGHIEGIRPEEPATPLEHPDCQHCGLAFLERAANRAKTIDDLRKQLTQLVDTVESNGHICRFAVSRNSVSKCKLCLEIAFARAELRKNLI